MILANIRILNCKKTDEIIEELLSKNDGKKLLELLFEASQRNHGEYITEDIRILKAVTDYYKNQSERGRVSQDEFVKLYMISGMLDEDKIKINIDSFSEVQVIDMGIKIKELKKIENFPEPNYDFEHFSYHLFNDCENF